MDPLTDEIEVAGDALRAFAEGPGRDAARLLEEAFAEAGGRIGQVLSEAARSGELDFRRMAEAILRDLARIAAQSVFGGGGGGAPAINISVVGAAPDAARSLLAGQGAIAAALARAAAAGGRFS